jgi:thioredoxin reductase (NADPH)
MSGPVLVAVDDDPDLLGDVRRELRRYAADYRICCLPALAQARTTLDELVADGAEGALVLAGEVLDGAPGTALLDEVPTTW